MNRLTLAVVGVFGAALLFCDNPSDKKDDTGLPPPPFVGEWTGGIPAIITDSIGIKAVIRSDSSYALRAWWKTGGDTALVNDGSWNATADSIFLKGKNCGIYDTARKLLVTRDCGSAPIAIRTDIEGNSWPIAFGELGVVAAAFNITIPDVLKPIPILLTKK